MPLLILSLLWLVMDEWIFLSYCNVAILSLRRNRAMFISLAIFPQFNLFTKVDHCWPRLTTVDQSWPPLTKVDHRLLNLVIIYQTSADKLWLTWALLSKGGHCWPSLTKADHCWLKLPLLTTYNYGYPHLTTINDSFDFVDPHHRWLIAHSWPTDHS